MKILFLTGDLSLIGGIEKYNQDLLESLKTCDCNIRVLQRKKGGFFKKIIFTFKTIFFIFSYKPNYIMCCHINFSPILLFINYFKEIDFSVSIYGIEAIKKFTFLKLLALKKANKIITISNYTENLIIEQDSTLKQKIVIIKSCVNEGSFIKKKLKFDKKQFNLSNKKIIMTLSRLSTSEEKGHDRVLKSLEILQQKFPDFIYMIVGGGTDTRVSEILSKNSELKKKVIFTGPIKDDEKYDYLSMADVFILPSKYEGFAIVFLEALLAGLIVIAPNKYGCSEGLLNGDLGILIDVDRADLIAEAILSVFVGEIPENLTNKKLIISKTIEIYGIERWNNDIKNFYESIKINYI